jgi:hypothetical protein
MLTCISNIREDTEATAQSADENTYNRFYIGVEAQHGNLLYLNPQKIQEEEIFRRSHQI